VYKLLLPAKSKSRWSAINGRAASGEALAPEPLCATRSPPEFISQITIKINRRAKNRFIFFVTTGCFFPDTTGCLFYSDSFFFYDPYVGNGPEQYVGSYVVNWVLTNRLVQ